MYILYVRPSQKFYVKLADCKMFIWTLMFQSVICPLWISHWNSVSWWRSSHFHIFVRLCLCSSNYPLPPRINKVHGTCKLVFMESDSVLCVVVFWDLTMLMTLLSSLLMALRLVCSVLGWIVAPNSQAAPESVD